MKSTLGQKLKNMGPAAIITSAFIGPGTITTATMAGVSFGYALLWTVVFSGISLIILMEMAARTVIASNMNVIDASIAIFPEKKGWKILIQAVVFLAVAAVCFAFQAGNEIGASSGLGDIFGMPQWLAALIVGTLAMLTAVLGSYKLLEKIMQIFVSLMGIIFFITMITVRPSLSGILKGIIPTLPEGSIVSSLALIGTTLVGINLIPVSYTHLMCIRDRLSPENIVICGGGGGIPVVKSGVGYRGVEAVVDKDLAAEKLAELVDADVLLILTGVEYVYINFNKPDEMPLKQVTTSELKRYIREHQFPEGSMLPKIQAAMTFAESGENRRSVITSIEKLDCFGDGAGTKIIAS